MGMFEDLTTRIAELEGIVVKLCGRVGHEWDVSSWSQCAKFFHRETDTPEKDTWSRTQCAVCGVFRCCYEADQ